MKAVGKACPWPGYQPTHTIRQGPNKALAWYEENIRTPEPLHLEPRSLNLDPKCIVAVDPRYFRPTEVETLLGDPTKAKEKLGWTPKITFDELVAEMVSVYA